LSPESKGGKPDGGLLRRLVKTGNFRDQPVAEDPRSTNSPATAIPTARTPSNQPESVGTLAAGPPGARVVVGLGDAVDVAVGVGVEVGVTVAVAS